MLNAVGMSSSREEKKQTLHKKNASSEANKPKLKTKYTGLRIDEIPDVDEEEEDTFLGKVNYKKFKSPQNIEEHLTAVDENLIHFNALAKYYGLN